MSDIERVVLALERIAKVMEAELESTKHSEEAVAMFTEAIRRLEARHQAFEAVVESKLN